MTYVRYFPTRSCAGILGHVPLGVILGQSNAVGRGIDASRTPVSTVAYRAHSDQVSQVVEQLWGPLAIRPTDNGFGAEWGIASAANYTIAIEKWARGATVLQPDGSNPSWLPSANDLYPQARSYLLAGPKVDFILWQQGESDASSSSAASNYGANMTLLSNALRSDLSAPNLVIIAVRVRPDLPQGFTASLRTSLAGWAGGRNVMMNIDDVAVGADLIHFDGPSLDIIGQRAWAAYSAFL